MSERNVLLKNVKHPFLVGLHYSFQTADKLYFVLDYINGGEVSGWPICRDDRKEMKKGCYLKTHLKMEGGQTFFKDGCSRRSDRSAVWVRSQNREEKKNEQTDIGDILPLVTE